MNILPLRRERELRKLSKHRLAVVRALATEVLKLRWWISGCLIGTTEVTCAACGRRQHIRIMLSRDAPECPGS